MLEYIVVLEITVGLLKKFMQYNVNLIKRVNGK